MTNARRQRLQEAKNWFASQSFTDDSHIVKAYRERFNVDKDCAMRELCLLKVLSPDKQEAYEKALKAKKCRRFRMRTSPSSPDILLPVSHSASPGRNRKDSIRWITLISARIMIIAMKRS